MKWSPYKWRYNKWDWSTGLFFLPNWEWRYFNPFITGFSTLTSFMWGMVGCSHTIIINRFPDSAEFWGCQTVWWSFFAVILSSLQIRGFEFGAGTGTCLFFWRVAMIRFPLGWDTWGRFSYLVCFWRLERKASKIGSLDNHQRLRAKFDEWHRQSLGRNASHETKLGQDQPRNFRRRKLTIGFHPLGIFAKKTPCLS